MFSDAFAWSEGIAFLMDKTSFHDLWLTNIQAEVLSAQAEVLSAQAEAPSTQAEA
jgi:hypothetical protein